MGVTRRRRSDAAANRERILAAATITVTRDGERVPMATIADEAGVGIGTLYRHFPTRPALLAALTLRSFQLVLRHARAQLILPLHGSPVIHDPKIVALRTEIRSLLEQDRSDARPTTPTHS
jgi:AcrR family transcriptional regulator